MRAIVRERPQPPWLMSTRYLPSIASARVVRMIPLSRALPREQSSVSETRGFALFVGRWRHPCGAPAASDEGVTREGAPAGCSTAGPGRVPVGRQVAVCARHSPGRMNNAQSKDGIKARTTPRDLITRERTRMVLTGVTGRWLFFCDPLRRVKTRRIASHLGASAVSSCATAQ